MMNTFKNKISSASEAFSAGDFNTNLKMVTKYAWLSAIGLFACYLYFIGAITFSVIKQESLAQNIKETMSQISKEELKYLNFQKNLTEEFAKEKGFVVSDAVSYTAPLGAFAWNTEHARE
jgi:hypothetical protein